VTVIDEDQGQSGASAAHRTGFQHLVAEVGLNHVGIVLGIEISRLARCNSDWYHLLDICALSHTLIADGDGVYDPREYNDRLLLGLKGTMSEAELHILRQRLEAGLWAKARRGELRIPVPMGYLSGPSGVIMKDPDEQVRGTIELVFATFERERTVNAVARTLLRHGIQLPVRERSGPDCGTVRWTRPCVKTLRKLLANPIYAGAYVYGRRTSGCAAPVPSSDEPLPERLEDRWEVCLQDHHPAYISWTTFERNIHQIQSNHPQRRGAIRRGPSLLAGLVTCGRCGHRMTTRYSQNGRGLRYCCEQERLRYQAARCQSVPGGLIDEAVERLVLEALTPLAVDLSLQAAADLEAERAQVLTHWTQRLERAQYTVKRAFRQYNAVDPENRLVARQLEQQWEEALQAHTALQADYDRVVARESVPLREADRAAIQAMARDLPALWHAPSTTNADRQGVVRQCVDRVVVTLVGKTEQMEVEVQWAGGARTAISLIRPVASLTQLSYYPELLHRAMALRAAGEEVEAIATRLTEEGWRPIQGSGAWTYAKVCRLLDQPEARSLKRPRRRISEGIPRQAHEWTPRELADRLGMSRDSLKNWIQKGALQGRKVEYHGRSLWLLWADEAELERLRDMRDFPHYGPYYPRVEQASSDTSTDDQIKKMDETANSACKNSTQDVL
jgi:DNA invertase Pin-like site-specific DNA recombinase